MLKDANINDYNLSKADLENILTVYIDKNDNLILNLNETLYVTGIKNLDTIIVEQPIHWSTLSYRLYGTTRLAWLLLKINGISSKNIFNKIDPNIPVSYLPKTDVITIINQINN
jgi:hypothetical protein